MMKVRSQAHRLLPRFAVFGIAVGLGLSLFAPSAQALSGSQFNKSNIISDGVFFNKSSMSVSQIQAFLNAKVPTCDTNGTQPYAGTTRAAYGASKGYPAPYTCLKDYRQAIPGKSADSYCRGSVSSGNKSAAQIIYDVAQACGVSPKVLIVLLQKEQSLVTDDWPWSIQYTKATGFYCPDDPDHPGWCDPAYGGFFNQVYNAARQYQRYVVQADYFNYAVGRKSFVSYQANAPSCGGTDITMQNKATAGLYNYTPYQPNKAALNNLYGQGDSCSAYGNRNFWRLFNDWFGSTQGIAYTATYVSQTANPSLDPNESKQVSITYTNAGNKTWYDDSALSSAPSGTKPVRLATVNPVNRSSDFRDASWLSSNRPTATFSAVYQSDGTLYGTNPHIVKPGESATFTFKLKAPSDKIAGSYQEYFAPVQEAGSGIIPVNLTVWVTVTVNPVYNAAYSGQSAYPTLRGGETKQAYITYKNTGNAIWFDNTSVGSSSGAKPVRLATVNPVNRASAFGTTSWGTGRNRPTGNFSVVYRKDGSAYPTNPHRVLPGESGRFEFTFTTPDNYTPGTYSEHFAPVHEGGSGIIPVNITPWLNLTVLDAPSAKALSTDHTTNINPLTTKTITYQFKNTGSTTWSQANTYLDVTNGEASKVRHSSWTSNSRVDRLNEATVAPGATGTFTVTYDAPQTGSKHNFKLAPSVSDQVVGLDAINVTLNVPAPTYQAKYWGQSPYPTVPQNTTKNVYFKFKNTGNIAWHDVTSAKIRGVRPVVLAATEPINRISKFNAAFPGSNRPAVNFAAVYESDGTTLASDQHVALPGQIIRYDFTLTVPHALSPGTYREWFQPIVEGGTPWSMDQTVFLNIKVIGGNQTAKFSGQSAFPTIAKGSSQGVFFKFKNTGNTSWHDVSSLLPGIRRVVLASTDPINRISKFNAAFPGSNRPAVNFAAVYESDGTTLASDQHIVKPGQIGRFNFTLTAPYDIASGTYREVFQPIVEGGTPWSMSQVAWLYVTVP